MLFGIPFSTSLLASQTTQSLLTIAAVMFTAILLSRVNLLSVLDLLLQSETRRENFIHNLLRPFFWLNNWFKFVAPKLVNVYLILVAFYVVFASEGMHNNCGLIRIDLDTGIVTSDCDASHNIFGIDDSTKLVRHIIHLPIFLIVTVMKMLFSAPSELEFDTLWWQLEKASARIGLLAAMARLPKDDLQTQEFLMLGAFMLMQPAALNLVVTAMQYRYASLIARPPHERRQNQITAENILIVLLPLSAWCLFVVSVMIAYTCYTTAMALGLAFDRFSAMGDFWTRYRYWLVPTSVIFMENLLLLVRVGGLMLQTIACYRNKHHKVLGGFYYTKLFLRMTGELGNVLLCMLCLYHSSQPAWAIALSIAWVSCCQRDATSYAESHRRTVRLRQHIASVAGTIPSAAELRQHNDECGICLDELRASSNLSIRLTCGHIFHGDCLLQLVMNDRTSCALCRRQFM